MRKLIVRILVLGTVAALVLGGFYLVQNASLGTKEEIALAAVKRGDLTVRSFFRGELRAVRSLTLTAPNLGSQSQVTKLAPAGALAKRGDLIVELDDSERVAALEDDRLEVEQVQEQLKQAETELEIRKLQDDVELTRAAFQVRRAELQVRRNELISAIDARKNELTLEEAQARQKKLEGDIKNRLAQSEAELAVIRERLTKAQLDVNREQRRIDDARVLAPISGLVSILENRSGGRGGFGTTTPTVQEGDQIPAGLAVAQLLDLSEMELVAQVEEVERANLAEGQEALIRLDALPGKLIHGKIKRLGATASINVFRGEATKKFDCILSIDMKELLGHVGATPEQIQRILATAEQNRSQGFGASRQGGAVGGGARGGFPGAGAGAGGGQPGGQAPEGAGAGRRQRGANGPGGAGGAAPSPEMRERMQAMLAGRQISELSAEERQQLRQRMQQELGGAPGGGGRGAPGGFSQQQRESATLPSPPDVGSDIDILLRPGLLADAEVIVENLRNVVYIPYQAVFDTTQGPVVYLWNGRTLEPRPVELGKRSESQVVILSGLEESDQISLQSPDGPATPRKKAAAKTSQAPGGLGRAF
ncbi:MAG: HlyD family efflux transporter periplasmic adaptor subunit [Acidobacteria bacterium]|nr:HlyD family efflux transporter periplasmic adaptor subunit [Acidobacteriota bacterium]MDA1233335.1 HlyD family efflux transporter periplasmic adaptor subunit [Acidobacteriota bacterium]